MDHLGEEAVGFSLFLDRGITSLVGFPFPGKVRLGSVQGQSAGLMDHLGKEAVGFSLF